MAQGELLNRQELREMMGKIEGVRREAQLLVDNTEFIKNRQREWRMWVSVEHTLRAASYILSIIIAEQPGG